jgi:hypothetical protein
MPGRGEIRVLLHATSLNCHDLGAVTGWVPADVGRIPMADDAGIIDAVGDAVSDPSRSAITVSTVSSDGSMESRRSMISPQRQRMASTASRRDITLVALCLVSAEGRVSLGERDHRRSFEDIFWAALRWPDACGISGGSQRCTLREAIEAPDMGDPRRPV